MIKALNKKEIYQKKYKPKKTERATITCYDGECFLDADTEVSGIELNFKGKAQITPELPEGWVMQGNKNKILIFNLQGPAITKQLLFTYKGYVKIFKTIICDSKGIRLSENISNQYIELTKEYTNFDIQTNTWDNMKNKTRKGSVKRTSYKLPDYGLPKLNKTKKFKKKKRDISRSSGKY